MHEILKLPESRMHETIMLIRLVRTSEFAVWLNQENLKSRDQIEARLLRVVEFGHFGDAKDLSKGLAELKWANGRRVYFDSNSRRQ